MGEARRSISALTSLPASSVMVSCRPFLGFFMRTLTAGEEQRPTTRFVSAFWALDSMFFTLADGIVWICLAAEVFESVT